jgi:collagen type VII alpha
LIGPKGDTGPTGPKGETGLTGPIGLTGPKGDTGETGDQGPKGDPGTIGPQGPIGPAGAKGDKGDKGDTGKDGMNRVDKLLVTDGLSTSDYVFGFDEGVVASEPVSGIIPLTLADSSVSPATLKTYYETRGVPEPFLTYLEDAVDGTQPFALIKGDGTTGIQLIDAAKHNLIATDVGMTVPGDYPEGKYTVTGDLNGASPGGEVMLVLEVKHSPAILNLGIGPKGLTGPAGPKGDKGDQGIQGILGEAGLTGPIGPTGLQGDKGATGDQGPKGDPGTIGPQGPIGPAGAKGDKGDKGDTGSTGETGPKGDPGAVGPQGPIGLTGATGPAGTNGVSGYERISGTASQSNTTSPKSATATCPVGKKVVGGGYTTSGLDGATAIVQNQAVNDTSWIVRAYRDGGSGSWSVQAFAICLTAA